MGLTHPVATRPEPPLARRARRPSTGRPSTGRPRAGPPAWLDQAAGWSWRVLALVGAAVPLLLVVQRLQSLLVALFAALLTTALLEPVVRVLQRRLPRTLAAGLALVVTAAVVVGTGVVIAGALAGQAGALAQAARQGLQTALDALSGLVGGGPDSAMEKFTGLASSVLGPDGGTGGGLAGLLGAAGTLWQVVTTMAVAVIATVILVFDGPRMWSAGLRPLPPRWREQLGLLGPAAWQALAAYAKGTLIVATIDAVGIGVGVAIVGVPLALPIGVLVFFSSFVPLIGALTSGLVAVLVALAWGGLTPALVVLVIVLVVQQVEGQVLEPLIQGRMVRIHPLGIVMAITVGTLVAGLAGAMLAVPAVSVVKAMVQAHGSHVRAVAGTPVMGQGASDPPRRSRARR